MMDEMKLTVMMYTNDPACTALFYFIKTTRVFINQ
jgi:hypothetical protein